MLAEPTHKLIASFILFLEVRVLGEVSYGMKLHMSQEFLVGEEKYRGKVYSEGIVKNFNKCTSI